MRRADLRGCAWPRRRSPRSQSGARRPVGSNDGDESWSWPVLAGEDGLVSLGGIGLGVVESVVESAALFSTRRALDDQVADEGERAQLEHVARHPVVPIVLADLLMEVLETPTRAS